MDWTEFRRHCPVTEHWTFLDHAAVAPLPRPAADAFGEYAADLSVSGITAYARWADRVRLARVHAGRLLGADPLDVAFVSSTSHGISLVAEGLDWQPGDNIVTAEEEYPANQYPWMNLASRGVEVRRVPSRGPRIALDDLHAAVDARTRVLALSFVEFASGYRNDLDAVGGFCRERGVLFCVDAIQGLGVLPLDVTRTPVDFIAADGHKFLLGPEGCGLFWCRRELVERLHPVLVGWNSVVNPYEFSTIDFRLKPHAGRWEGGCANLAGIAALGASLGLLLDAGVEHVRDRVKALTDHACERAASAGLEVFSARGEAEWSGILSLTVPGVPAAEAMKRCKEAGVVVNARAGRVRLSPHCYNTDEEIDRAVGVLAAMRG
jgi:selenocysteine lyase/cysteine desulfurase